MAKCEIKITGLEQLKQKLERAKQELETRLSIRLLRIGEEAAEHAKLHKGYQDRTANLKNSISFALYKDGQPVAMELGRVVNTEQIPDAQAMVNENVQAFINDNKNESGFVLMIVAGMNYGKHVQNKGYNVLELTRYFVQDRLKEEVEDVIQKVMKGEI